MEQVVLEAKSRTPGGKGAARKQRREGLVPGVAYGHGLDPMPLLVDERTLTDVLRHHRGGNVLFDLRVDGTAPGGFAAIVKSMQSDPVTDDLLAVDFQWVSLQEHVTVQVRIRLQGRARGAEEGGIVDQALHEVEVSCLPLEMPEELVLDISAMEIGDTLHVSDLAEVAVVVVLAHAEEPAVTVRPPVVVAEVAPVAEEAAAEEGEEAAEAKAEGEAEE